MAAASDVPNVDKGTGGLAKMETRLDPVVAELKYDISGPRFGYRLPPFLVGSGDLTEAIPPTVVVFCGGWQMVVQQITDSENYGAVRSGLRLESPVYRGCSGGLNTSFQDNLTHAAIRSLAGGLQRFKIWHFAVKTDGRLPAR
eukprot:8404548-Pyramimonas_sp.AAC.1